MNLKAQLARAFILSLFSAVFFGLIAFLVSSNNNRIVLFDNSIISFVGKFESPLLTEIMKFFTFIGSGISVTVLSIFVLFFLYKVQKHRAELILFLAVVAGASILNQILKSLFHRSRPSLHRLVEVSGFSFPSGHSMEAFAFYGILAFLLWRHLSTSIGRGMLIMVAALMILAIGMSRIYLGVHYPSDILGGYFASGFWLTAAIWFYQRYKEKRYQKFN